MKNLLVKAYVFIAFLIIFLTCYGIVTSFIKVVYGSDLDTTNIEILEICRVYDFVVEKDTVYSNTHYYISNYKAWYVKGIYFTGHCEKDFLSDKKPIILKQFKEWE